jgi:hypothetical protein
MPQRGGFPQAQIDSSFPADPKHQRLARKLAALGAGIRPEHDLGDDEPEDLSDVFVLAGIGLWALSIAHAWANDDANVDEVVEDQRRVIVEALIDSKLLKNGGEHVTVPEASFAKWTDAARRARESARERAARSRASRGSSENSGEPS